MNLENLLIKNDSNHEFLLEEEVYEYLQDLKHFLLRYTASDMSMQLTKVYDGIELTVLSLWERHMSDLIVELFNSFVAGNFITSTAVTRTLIECYVYLSILKENPTLIEDWFLYGGISTSKNIKNRNFKEEVERIMKKYCCDVGMEYQEVLRKFEKKKKKGKEELVENGWLISVIPEFNGRISFKQACKYLKKQEIYHDFSRASAFVHGQDMASKMALSTFYAPIFHSLVIMADYIFKALQVFPLENDLLEEIEKLKAALVVLEQKLDM